MRLLLFIFLIATLPLHAQRQAFFLSTVQMAEVAVKDIVSVESLAPITVPYGTAFNLLDLPEEVEVTLDNSATRMLDVTWNEGAYDPDEPDTYTLEGDLTLDDDLTNTSNLTAEIDVTVEPYDPEPSPSSITSNHVYSGTDKALIYQPPGYDDNEDLYPLIIFYHGNGERGIPEEKTYSVGTGNGSTDSYSGNITNTQRIVHSEFSVEVNSVVVATGVFGAIIGPGVSGTYDQDDNNSSAYTLDFDTPPTNGHSIVFKYTQANALSTGPMRFMNQGDEPNVLYVAPQIQRPQEVGSFTPETDWDDVLDYLDNEGYRFDPNRIYITGLSLGGDQIIKLFNERNPGSGYTWAAFVCAAPGSDTGVPSSSPGTVYTNATNKGKLVVRGTSDGNGTFSGMMANSNGTDREFPVQMLQYWGIGHSSSLWDSKVYNRANRTDGGGAADFDYIEDFMLQFSLDQAEQATLWVEKAERTEDSGDYRVGVRQVSLMSNGAPKTALQGRLSAVASSIGAMAVVDIGHASFTSGGNFNNLTNNGASQTVSNLTNYVSGANTGWSFTCVTPPASSPTTVNNIGSSSRVRGRTFGFIDNTTRDGHQIDAGGTTGTYRFSGLDNGEAYTIKVYSAMGQSSWSNRAEVEVVCNSTTKYAFNDPVNFFAKDSATSGAYVIFKNVSPSSGEIDFTIKTRQTASTERESYIQAVEIIQEP